MRLFEIKTPVNQADWSDPKMWRSNLEAENKYVREVILSIAERQGWPLLYTFSCDSYGKWAISSGGNPNFHKFMWDDETNKPTPELVEFQDRIERALKLLYDTGKTKQNWSQCEIKGPYTSFAQPAILGYYA